MGLFDTFYDYNKKIKCIKCNKSIDISIGVQSKKFDKILDNYEIGDYVESNNYGNIVEDWIWCEHCNERIPIFLSFKDKIFVGIFPTRNTAEIASNKFNIIVNYKKLFYEKSKHEQRVINLESMIQETINVHGNIPTQKNFNLMYNLSNKFIDYDIIKTLKNILKHNYN